MHAPCSTPFAAVLTPPALAETQRLFFTALQEPLVGGARSLTELAPIPAPENQHVSASFDATAHALLNSTTAVSAPERLGLYHRQYWYRILDSLAEDFPHLLRLLGRDAFWALLERYLAAHPPASFTLRHLGAGFADFIATDTMLSNELRAWSIDVVRFEYAFMAVFEEASLPVPADTDFATHEIGLQPAIRLMTASHPLTRWLRSPEVSHDQMRPRNELIVVWRDAGNRLRHTREPLALAPLLMSLRTGGLLNEILARVHRLPSAAMIERGFARWRQLGWLALLPHPKLN